MMARTNGANQDRSGLLATLPNAPAVETAALLASLARQIAACHAGGELHLHVGLATLVGVEGKQPQFERPVGLSEVAVGDEKLPPELRGIGAVTLPVSLPGAAAVLRDDGDPRRIDLYHLGLVACRLLADATEQEYLRSPTKAARVPAELRAVVDGCLGFDAKQRFASCGAVVAALEAVALGKPPVVDTPRHGTGIDVHRDTPRPTSLEAATPDELPFTKLGHYEVRSRLGGGGMGDVYEAYDPTLDRPVAIKVLPPDLARNAAYVERFQSEARAAAKLSHPNLVSVYYIGSDEPAGAFGVVHYFAMALVEGPSLARVLSEQGSLSAEQTLGAIRQVVAGLREAHAHGLIHRDIKPGNVLIDEQRGTAMLADFGLVKSLEASAAMTATGVVMGTVDYIAPEQGRGKRVDERSDLYSIGVLLYQMRAGRLPFEAESPTAMIFQHAYEAPPSLAEAAPTTPDDLVRIAARLMEKDPDNRHASADELLADLDRVDLKATRNDVGQASCSLLDASAPTPASRLTTAASSFFAKPLGWRRRLLARFNQHAPEALRELQNTQLQVEGGIAVYEDRREKLVSLVQESADIERDLKQQATELDGRIAAGDTSLTDERIQLEEQLVTQRRETSNLQSRLKEIDGTLARLRSERDVLIARLKVAKSVFSELISGELLVGDEPAGELD